MKHLLVIRNSSMGDVALTVPSVKALLDAYPDVRVTFVSQREFAPFYEGVDRLYFYGADFKSEHKGFFGIMKLAFRLMKMGRVDAVLDLHSVIRSWLITAPFLIAGTPVFRINKGRKDKKAITRKHRKVFKRLRPAYKRYADVIRRAGYAVSMGKGPWIDAQNFPYNFFQDKLLLPKGQKWIGIAPFAQHKGKMWPENKSELLIQELAEGGHTVFLFGGGQGEKLKLERWASRFQGVYSLAEKFPLGAELAVMQNLDVMVTMDSSNLHMASLVGTPVVSIWGSTHSYAGFEPLGKNKHLKVEIDPHNLKCRPCSVFGNKPCFRGDYACLNWIAVKDVKTKVQEVLGNAN